MILGVKRFERFGADFPLQKELADYTNTNEADVSRWLKRLTKRGLMRREKATNERYRSMFSRSLTKKAEPQPARRVNREAELRAPSALAPGTC